MKKLLAFAVSIALCGATLLAHANDDWGGRTNIKHVLLISIDGMHADIGVTYSGSGKKLAEHGGFSRVLRLLTGPVKNPWSDRQTGRAAGIGRM
jgi:hypothetical protein